MKEICIPVPHFGENQIAEVEVTVNGKREQFHFRVESFPWGDGEGNDLAASISALRDNIEAYDNGWELVQIFTPREEAEYIQVLFRQRKNKPKEVLV